MLLSKGQLERILFQHLEVRCFLFFTSYLNKNVFLIYKTRFHFLARVRFSLGEGMFSHLTQALSQRGRSQT